MRNAARLVKQVSCNILHIRSYILTCSYTGTIDKGLHHIVFKNPSAQNGIKYLQFILEGRTLDNGTSPDHAPIKVFYQFYWSCHFAYQQVGCIHAKGHH